MRTVLLSAAAVYLELTMGDGSSPFVPLSRGFRRANDLRCGRASRRRLFSVFRHFAWRFSLATVWSRVHAPEAHWRAHLLVTEHLVARW